MRRLLTVGFLSLLVALFALTRVAADNSMSGGSMKGLPENHRYLIGTWQCTVKLAAMEGEAARTDHGTLTISMSPGMSLHTHVSAADYMSDSYQGYDAKTKTHWLSGTDAYGNASLEMSTDGKVFVGTDWVGTTATPVRDTQTKISDTKIRDVSESKINGKWTQMADAVCTKSS